MIRQSNGPRILITSYLVQVDVYMAIINERFKNGMIRRRTWIAHESREILNFHFDDWKLPQDREYALGDVSIPEKRDLVGPKRGGRH